VVVDRAGADEQAFRDFPVGRALGDVGRDLQLLRGEAAGGGPPGGGAVRVGGRFVGAGPIPDGAQLGLDASGPQVQAEPVEDLAGACAVVRGRRNAGGCAAG